MPLNPLHGFARGLFVGLAAGLVAGVIEAISLVRDAPTGRAALMEAGLYAVLVHPMAQAFALQLFTHPGRLAAGAFVPIVALGLVFPVQVLLEARQHTTAAASVPEMRSIDPGLLESDYSADLEAALARVGTL